MTNENWDELDFLDEEELTQEKKSKGKIRKSKWREIEHIKEQRRLRRDLSEYEYEYPHY
jgi:hypothetical protein